MLLLHLLAPSIVSTSFRELLMFFLLLPLKLLIFFILLCVKLVLLFRVFLVGFGVAAFRRSRTLRPRNVVGVDGIAATGADPTTAGVSRASMNSAALSCLHDAATAKVS